MLKKIVRISIVLFLTVAVGSALINMGMIKDSKKYVYTAIGDIPEKTTVLVLGSQIRGRRLSRVLEDRVVAGIDLIETGTGRKLLLSGDHGQRYYDEVNAMRLYVLANAPGIAEADIFMDHAGFNTYDSMYRARDVFEVRDLIIVTQQFHVSRAVFIARNLGLDAVAYAQSQEKFDFRTRMSWETREYLARVKAFIYIVFKPKPRYLGDKIPIIGDGRKTWI
ncbi:MAG: YdcF family protein [Treponema sp.]|nr:YdcF family protein [Treponema sp.]